MRGQGESVWPADKGVSGADGAISRRLNRPVSRRISPRLAALPLTPNHWSWVAFGLVCAGAGAFALGAPRAGALLTHAGSVVDGVDGEVARLQGTASEQGAFLDLVLDRMADTALLAGLSAGAGGRATDWLLALAAANGIVTASVAKERLSAEGVAPAELQRREAAGGDWVAKLMPLGGRDGRLFAVAIAGLLRRPRLALGWLAVSSSLRLVRRLSIGCEALRQSRGDGKVDLGRRRGGDPAGLL
ncbi:MAG: CDP-alcohol phosphatidyltransferase family protein [Dehalococcoidia bacterium]